MSDSIISLFQHYEKCRDAHLLLANRLEPAKLAGRCRNNVVKLLCWQGDVGIADSSLDEALGQCNDEEFKAFVPGFLIHLREMVEEALKNFEYYQNNLEDLFEMIERNIQSLYDLAPTLQQLVKNTKSGTAMGETVTTRSRPPLPEEGGQMLVRERETTVEGNFNLQLIALGKAVRETHPEHPLVKALEKQQPANRGASDIRRCQDDEKREGKANGKERLAASPNPYVEWDDHSHSEHDECHMTARCRGKQKNKKLKGKSRRRLRVGE